MTDDKGNGSVRPAQGASTPDPPREPLELRARIRLFGFEPTGARVVVRPRSRRWRLVRALRVAAGALAIAPLVALIPPHAPWAIGALAGGVVLALRRWRETHTVMEMTGACPRCGEEVRLPPGTRLERPHTISCEACRHQSALHVEGLEPP